MKNQSVFSNFSCFDFFHFLLFFLCCFGLPASAGRTEENKKLDPNKWEVVNINPSRPSPREFAAVSFAGEMVYLFGGNSGDVYLQDLWSYDPSSTTWTLATNTLQTPLPRSGATMVTAVQNGHEVVVLFGGQFLFPNDTLTAWNDLWIFNPLLSTWFAVDVLNTSSIPAPRFHHTATMYSPTKMVVFGGTQPNGTNLNDVWVFDLDLGTWTMVATTQAPPARSGHAAGMLNGSLLMFGGCVTPVASAIEFCQFDVSNTTDASMIPWLFTLDPSGSSGNWSLGVSIQGTPSSWYSATFQIQGSSSPCFGISGGLARGYIPSNSSYIICGTSWIPLNVTLVSESPSARYGSAVVYIDRRQSLLLFSGAGGLTLFDDLWEYSLISTAWSERHPVTFPEPRVNGAMGTIQDNIYFFFGLQANGLFSDNMWEYDIKQKRWFQMFPNSFPPLRKNALSISYNKSIYVFGGDRIVISGTIALPGPFFNDMWVFTLLNGTASWSKMSPSGLVPSNRSCSVGTRYLDSFILFGGMFDSSTGPTPLFTPNYLFADTWVFNLTTLTWSNITGSLPVSPSPRAASSSAMLNSTYWVIVGGVTSSGLVDETWSFDLTSYTWSILVSLDGPSPRAFSAHSALASAFLVVVGGSTYSLFSGLTVYQDVWIGSLQRNASVLYMNWQQVETSSPVSIEGTNLISDNEHGVISFFSGIVADDTDSNSIHITPYYYSLNVTCNAGSESVNSSFLNCRLCPIGMYNALPGGSCLSCPGDASTPLAGSRGIRDCHVCARSTCAHASSCTVSNDGIAQCSCKFGYLGKQCQTSWIIIAAGSLGGLILLLIIARLLFGRFQSLKHDKEYTQLLLDQSKSDLSEIMSVWAISSSEIDLIEQVGTGAFGYVWKAYWKKTEQDVAVKFLRMGASNTLKESLLEKFDHEIKFIRSVHHPNIVAFYGAGVFKGAPFDGIPFFCTEFVERGSLFEILKDGSISLPWKRRVSFLIGVAKGMNYLHAQFTPPRIHRDLKSLNLLVSADWIIKIADFGTARGSVIEESLHTSVNASSVMTRGVGTLLWSSPEILRGKRYTFKVDVYSFGIVMWELLTRKEPYHDFSPTEELPGAIERGLRPQIPSDCPPEYSEIMTQCWDANPDIRPTFGELIPRLKQL